jgi:hypothetical protein
MLCRDHIERGIWIVLGFLFFFSCTPTEKIPTLQVNLFSGIHGVVKLGESESRISKREHWSLSKSPPDPSLQKLGFRQVYEWEEIGVRAYIRHGRVALIEVQEPFRGGIQGKKVQLFSFAAPEGKGWDEILTSELGAPSVRASGGRFGSESLFYSWGDLSFNRMGPNQIALYRDSDLSNYRQNNFGRELKLFPR